MSKIQRRLTTEKRKNIFLNFFHFLRLTDFFYWPLFNQIQLSRIVCWVKWKRKKRTMPSAATKGEIICIRKNWLINKCGQANSHVHSRSVYAWSTNTRATIINPELIGSEGVWRTLRSSNGYTTSDENGWRVLISIKLLVIRHVSFVFNFWTTPFQLATSYATYNFAYQKRKINKSQENKRCAVLKIQATFIIA